MGHNRNVNVRTYFTIGVVMQKADWSSSHVHPKELLQFSFKVAHVGKISRSGLYRMRVKSE